MFLCAELSTSLLVSPSLATAKKVLLFSMTDEKFIFNACSVLGLYSVEIKSDDGYQIGRRISSDNYRPIVPLDQRPRRN